MDKIEIFICKLREVIELAERECDSIDAGNVSKWNKGVLKNCVSCEMHELLTYALKGEVLFKYGKKQRLLKSTYILTDSLEHLDNTPLGEKITELQKLYYSL